MEIDYLRLGKDAKALFHKAYGDTMDFMDFTLHCMNNNRTTYMKYYRAALKLQEQQNDK